MLKITNNQLVNSQGALKALGEVKDMPTKLLWRIKRVITVCRPVLVDFQETTQGLAQKYGKKDEEGKLVVDPQTGNSPLEDAAAYVAAMKELMEEEVSLDLNKIPASLLPDKGLPPAHLMADLDWVIEDDLGE